MKAFSNVDGEPAWIAVGGQPIGVIAIGATPVGIIAIAGGAGRGVVVVSCGAALGAVTITCGLSAAIYSVGVGLHLALWGRGMTLAAFGPGNPKYALARKVAIPALILAAFAFFGRDLLASTRMAVANRAVTARWSGVAKTSEGLYVAPGTPCTVEGSFRGDGKTLVRLHVAVTCGHLKLFESGPIRSGSGSTELLGTDDLSCYVWQTPAVGGFAYAARCRASQYRGSGSSSTAVFGPRPSLMLDTNAGRAVLDLDGSQPMHVEIAVDRRSAPVAGDGLFAH